ncbi:unnamed protein product, partial [Scytosiphon promiscuus]
DSFSALGFQAENRLDGVSARARIDIRDLDMAGLPSIVGEGDDRPVVAVAKHLCGVATDLALRFVEFHRDKETRMCESLSPDARTHTVHDPNIAQCLPSLTTIPPALVLSLAAVANVVRVGGVAIATCCHHACSWRDYAGREFLVQQGFSARDFEAMRRISAW